MSARTFVFIATSKLRSGGAEQWANLPHRGIAIGTPPTRACTRKASDSTSSFADVARRRRRGVQPLSMPRSAADRDVT